MTKLKLHWWILIGMGIGALLGAVVHAIYPVEVVRETAVYQVFDAVASMFLNLLKMIVVPLVFFSLLAGMLGMGDLAGLGRMGVKTFTLYIMTSLIAIVTGLVLVNVIRPGVGIESEIPTEGIDKPVPESVGEVITNMIPDSVVKAAAETELVGVILFAILFGAMLLPIKDGKGKVVVRFIEGACDVMMRMVRFVLSLAPIGIAALIARMVSSTGIGVFLDLRWYVVTVFLALGAHLLITLPALIFFTVRGNPYRYLRAVSPALLTGFSTASSSGTLGVTMERVESAGVSNRVASFVLPIGATVNMDGTALYEIVSVLFIAQIHAGIDPGFSLTLGQQLLIVFLGLAVSIGAAGIPHAGLVMMVIILQAVGLPLEYTGLIWAVDRILDMCRTAVNIASDSSVTLIVADSENEVDKSLLWG
jgi:Na+/H+-dicarboxylate symporter